MRPLIIEVPSPLGLRPSGVELAPFDDNDRFGSEHVRDSGITVLDYRDLRAGTVPLILDRALATVTKPELSAPGACGLDVTIFNPNLDPDRSIARQLCELIGRCVATAS